MACVETPSHSRAPGNSWVRVRVSFTTGAVRSAILATAGLLVTFLVPAHPGNSRTAVKRLCVYDNKDCWDGKKYSGIYDAKDHRHQEAVLSPLLSVIVMEIVNIHVEGSSITGDQVTLQVN